MINNDITWLLSSFNCFFTVLNEVVVKETINKSPCYEHGNLGECIVRNADADFKYAAVVICHWDAAPVVLNGDAFLDDAGVLSLKGKCSLSVDERSR